MKRNTCLRLFDPTEVQTNTKRPIANKPDMNRPDLLLAPKIVMQGMFKGKCGIPVELLKRVVILLGYTDRDENNGPDKQSNHNTILGLERTASMILGPNPLLWSAQIQNKPYLDEDLGLKLFYCFRPILPKGVQLLDSKMIQDALRVYQDVESLHFSFYGPYAASHKFDPYVEKMKSDAKKLGFVINTTAGEGSHWVALLIDLDKAETEYFDSLGFYPSEKVRTTVDYIMDGVRKMYPWCALGTKVCYTNKRKQYGVTECGIYVVWYLVQRVCEELSLKALSDINLPDSECRKFRKIFWNEVDVDDSAFQVK